MFKLSTMSFTPFFDPLKILIICKIDPAASPLSEGAQKFESRVRRAGGSICPHIQRLNIKRSFGKEIGLTTEERMGFFREALTGLVRCEAPPEWFRPTQRGIQGQQDTATTLFALYQHL